MTKKSNVISMEQWLRMEAMKQFAEAGMIDYMDEPKPTLADIIPIETYRKTGT